MQVEIIRDLPESNSTCYVCMDPVSLETEIEIEIANPKITMMIVNGEMTEVSSRGYVCSETCAGFYTKHLTKRGRLVTSQS